MAQGVREEFSLGECFKGGNNFPSFSFMVKIEWMRWKGSIKYEVPLILQQKTFNQEEKIEELKTVEL